jgi:hypothetical protein
VLNESPFIFSKDAPNTTQQVHSPESRCNCSRSATRRVKVSERRIRARPVLVSLSLSRVVVTPGKYKAARRHVSPSHFLSRFLPRTRYAHAVTSFTSPAELVCVTRAHKSDSVPALVCMRVRWAECTSPCCSVLHLLILACFPRVVLRANRRNSDFQICLAAYNRWSVELNLRSGDGQQVEMYHGWCKCVPHINKSLPKFRCQSPTGSSCVLLTDLQMPTFPKLVGIYFGERKIWSAFILDSSKLSLRMRACPPKLLYGLLPKSRLSKVGD